MQPAEEYPSFFNKLLFEMNIACSSLIFPLFLLLIIYIFRNIFLILILHFFILTVLLICSIYYKYFQTIPHINVLSQIYLLPHVFNQIFVQLFGINELIISGCIFLSIGFSFKLSTDIKKNQFNIIPKKRLLFCFLIILTVCIIKGIWVCSIRPLNRLYVSYIDSVCVLKQHGFTPVYLDQFIKRMFKEKKVVPWPGKINSSTQSAAFRNKNKKNVIIIQLESASAHIIDYRLGEKYVMPYFRLLKKQNIYFKYFFAQKRPGGSSDAELSSLTSLIPLDTHSGLRTADYQKITPLNKVLAKEGYYCAGIHANTGRYFDRIQSYTIMGFDAFFDEQAFQGEAAGWYSKDKAFFEQTVKMLRSLPQPFFAYIITMQGHGPFRNYSINPDTFDLSGLDREHQDYILTMHEVDQALSVFMAELEKYGFLKNTIFIIYGDFPPLLNYSISGQDSACYVHPLTIPLLIIDADLSPDIKYKVGSRIDIGPTILDLVGIKEPDGWLGSSLLQPGTGKAILSYKKPYILINQGSAVIQDHNYDNYFKFTDYSISILDP